MITGLDVVCLSTQDWSDLWTRKQRFMQWLARRGNRVLYVEAQWSLASLGLLRTDRGRAWRWLRGPRPVEPSLAVATLPLVWPGFQMSAAVNGVNNAVLAPLLRRWIRGLGLRSPVLWTYTPYSGGLIGRLGESFAVYDCVDEFAASRGLVRPAVVRDLERRLLARARAVVVTHENLLRSKRAWCREIHLVPNGVEVDHFRAAARPETPIAPEMRPIPRPVIGVLGTLQYWIDFDLLAFLARARPRWSFVLVGPRGRLGAVGRLADLSNVHLLGRKPYGALPSYLKAFDVCLNPYVPGELAEHCSPLKLYEYLATGKPVVSVDMPEARRFESVIRIGRTPDEILARLEEALDPAAEPEQRREARMRAVEAHAWEGRFEALEAVLAGCVAPRDPASAPELPAPGP